MSFENKAKSTPENKNALPSDDSVKWFFISVFVSIVLLLVFVIEPDDWFGFAREPLPAFSEIEEVSELKEAFFSYLRPLVDEVNQAIEKDRNELQDWIATHNNIESVSADEWKTIIALAEKYRVEDPQPSVALLEELRLRIAPIPSSLVLAQAANESSWGRSRFAQEGNNLFGQWCFEPECGIVPKNRPDGRDYEVADFSSPKRSIESYMMNLNTFYAYDDLRQIRATLIAENKRVTGYALAQGLLNYSERRQDYVEEIRDMIKVNSLE